MLKLLGEPEYIGEHKWADIYSYGPYEFYLAKEEWKGNVSKRFNCFVGINITDSSNSKNFLFKNYGWTKELLIDDAISFLNENKIEFEERNSDNEDDVRTIYTRSNIFIHFRDWQENGRFALYKFGKNVELNPIKPPTKQISFEIEEIFYNQLQKRAEETKISIANQCRDIFENHLKYTNSG